MFCKFCGQKIEANATFCSKCGNMLDIEVDDCKKTVQVSNEKNSPEEPKVIKLENASQISFCTKKEKFIEIAQGKIAQRILLGGCIAGVLGVILFLFFEIFCNSLGLGEGFLAFTVILMFIGVLSVVVKVILFFAFKIGEVPQGNFKRILFVASAILLMVCSIWGFVDSLSTKSSSDSSGGGYYGGGYTITTSSQAIAAAKESKTVQDEIASFHKLKFYYTPDWGTSTAKKNSDGSWEVTLKGNISGYTDDYKNDYEYDKTFRAVVDIDILGTVTKVFVLSS